MLLPLVTTFDELLTTWAMQLGANNPLQAIVPAEARMVVGLLGLAGIHVHAEKKLWVGYSAAWCEAHATPAHHDALAAARFAAARQPIREGGEQRSQHGFLLWGRFPTG